MDQEIFEVIKDAIPDGYFPVAEGEFTKLIQLNNPYELDFVDKLACLGWVLVSILPIDGVYLYWFQSKRKIYIHTKTTH